MPNPVRKVLRRFTSSHKRPRNSQHCHAETEVTRERTDSQDANIKASAGKRAANHEEQPSKRVNTSGSWKHLYSNRPQSETQRNSPLPERVVTSFSAGQASDEAQSSSNPTSDKPSPRPARSSPTWSSVLSNSGSSIKTALKKLNCIPPIFAHYPQHHTSQLPEKRHQGISRARTDLATSRKSPLTHPGLESSASGKLNEIPPRPIPRPFTFPKTAMSTSGRNLQSLHNRLRARAETSGIFNKIWEEKALPCLEHTMDTSFGRDYNITIQFDYNHSKRIVEIMTEVKLPDDIGEMIQDKVLPIFREPRDPLSVGFHFTEGKIERCADMSTDADAMQEDGWNAPANTASHSTLMLGDSISYEGGDCAATLGPGIVLQNRNAYVISRHLVDHLPEYGMQSMFDYHLVHPANIDCPNDRQPQRIAQLYIHSGPAYQTQQPSTSLQLFTENLTPTQVVTDWAVCFAAEDSLPMQNCLRYAPKGREFHNHSDPIPGLSLENPQLRLICSTGRSSGIRYGVVCETPAVVYNQSSGKRSREWYVENPEGVPGTISTGEWNSGGIGLPGDSGAAIIDEGDQRLIGQVWGRNIYGGNPEIRRTTYFTHFLDIFDDIYRHPATPGYPFLVCQTDKRIPGPLLVVVSQNGNNAGSIEAEVDGTTLSSSRRSRAQSSATDEITVGRSASNRSLAYCTTNGADPDAIPDVSFAIREKLIDSSSGLSKPSRGISLLS